MGKFAVALFALMNEHDPVIRSGQSGKDLDQARLMYEDGYNGTGFRTELTDSEFGFHYTVAGDKNMTLRSSMFLGTIEGAIQPENEYVVAWLSQGEAAFTVDDEVSPLQLGRPAMFPTGKRFVFQATDFKESLIHFNASFLEEVAAEHEGVLLGPLEFDHRVAPRGEALARWRSTVDEAARTILASSPTPLQLDAIDRRTAAALLDTFPHRKAELPPELLNPRNARLREAVEYVHAHVHLPLSPTDIAEKVGLSPRGLQQAFQRQLGMTPTEYLRVLRLDRVRIELEHLSPEEVSVGDVAARWGFTHAGRFAANYTARFGEQPSATLRR